MRIPTLSPLDDDEDGALGTRSPRARAGEEEEEEEGGWRGESSGLFWTDCGEEASRGGEVDAGVVVEGLTSDPSASCEPRRRRT